MENSITETTHILLSLHGQQYTYNKMEGKNALFLFRRDREKRASKNIN